MQKTPRFLDLYHAGEVAPAEIDDHIDAWHVLPRRVQLHVHLGMTWAEYRTWVQDGWLPTAEQHAAERADVLWTGPGSGDLLRVHPPARCRPACPVHWPSDHPQAEWPLGWRADIGIITRLCPHDKHHPDPDDQQVRLHPELAEHTCDGCCMPTIEGECEDDEPAVDILAAYARAEIAGRTGRTERPR